MGPAPASGTGSIALPPEGAIPASLKALGDRIRNFEPTEPCGLVRRVEQIERNRADLEAGRITEAEAQARGGLRVTGTGSVVVLPTLFSNSGEPPWNVNALETQLFVYSPTGTMNDYYQEISYGSFGVDGVVQEWRTASHGDFWYEGADHGRSVGIGSFALDAFLVHDQGVDFGQFDNDGPDGIPNSGDDDGYVDIAYIVHPKTGGECGGGIWSVHTFYEDWFGQPKYTNDPAHGGGHIKLNRFVICPALSCGTGMIEIGVFCHEFGHVLNLPDLYDTDPSLTGGSEGLGWWALMAAGNWNSVSSPAHMCAHSKHRLGWLDYVNVDHNLASICIPPVETEPVAVRVWAFGAAGPEYFLVENRQPLGFDQHLAKEGLLIYHVDDDRYSATLDNNTVNANEVTKGVDLECADAYTAEHIENADDLDRSTNRGDSLDVWCMGGNNNTFNAVSIPDTRSKGGVPTPVAIRNITACEGGGIGIPPEYICAAIDVGVASPVDVCIEDCPGDNCNELATCEDWWASPDIWIDNDEDGDSDLPAIGAANKLWTRVHNLGPDIAVGTTVELYIAKGALGLEWPIDAADGMLGVTGIPVIEAGSEDEDYVIFNYPDLLQLVGHFCIGAVIQQTYDPTNGTSAPLTNNIAQINSQVLFARGDGDQAEGGRLCPGPFVKETQLYLLDGYNPPGGIVQAEVRIGSPPDFDDAVIPDGWEVELLPSTGPYILYPGMKDSVIVRVSAELADHGDAAHVPITLWNIVEQRSIGGIVQDYIVDCQWPMAPEHGYAEWLPPRGDDLQGPNVEVEWDPVELDEMGDEEHLQYYEVYRADEAGGPFALIAQVAIDAEPDTAQFQFHDRVPAGLCPTVFTYQIRAVDGYGAGGPFSEPLELHCPASDVGVEPEPRAATRILGSFPNPSTSSTTIRFQLDRPGTMDLSVFDVGGQCVRHLVSGSRSAGNQEVIWDGRNEAGQDMPSGIYFVRIATADAIARQMLVLMR